MGIFVSKFKFPVGKFGDDQSFIIAEVGQNHQGDESIALSYVSEFARAGADAVKFQTRNNKSLFAPCAYDRTYNSENAFAPTYGAHREKLELDSGFLVELKAECVANNVFFMSTPFDEPSLSLLLDVGVDLLKVASFDLGNIPFLLEISETALPVVLSTGGGNSWQIEKSISCLRSGGAPLAVLHCVSEYPCPADRLGLQKIEELSGLFPDLSIGLSDHFNGILSGPIAYMKGARVFEKHVTLNRAWKGTDHSFALNVHGFENFVRDIRRVPQMLSVRSNDELGQEPVFKKLGKSVVAKRDLQAGHKLLPQDLSSKIFVETGLPVRESYRLIGKTLLRTVKAGEKVLLEHCEDG